MSSFDEVLFENQRLFRTVQEMQAERKELLSVIKGFEKGFGCFCGCPYTRTKLEHSEACYRARAVMEKSGKKK